MFVEEPANQSNTEFNFSFESDYKKSSEILLVKVVLVDRKQQRHLLNELHLVRCHRLR